VTATIALYLWHEHKLTFGSYRFFYFLYIGTAGLIAAALPRKRQIIAGVLVSLAWIDLGLGMGSGVMKRLHLGPSILAPDIAQTPTAWHPLLQVVPRSTPPGVHAHAFIDSQHLRGGERDPATLKTKIVVALFGGSTTFDIIPADGQTWADRLEALLGSDYAVLNHGVMGYTTAENLIQTAFYESSYGTRPRCAVYYEGWNDARNSHISNLDPGYADFHLRSQIDAQEARRLSPEWLTISPVFRALSRVAVWAADTARPAGTPDGEISGGPDPAVEAIYARNIETISAINRARGIKTLWVGQIMNLTGPTLDIPSSEWVPLVPDKDLWSIIARLNGIARERASKLGDTYVDMPIDVFEASDFFDEGHFYPKGSAKFAQLLAPAIASACR
jgi:lysophospholipase L1-like esterase